MLGILYLLLFYNAAVNTQSVLTPLCIEESKCVEERRYADQHSTFADLGRLAVLEVTEPLELFFIFLVNVAEVAVQCRLALLLDLKAVPSFKEYLGPYFFNWKLEPDGMTSLKLVAHHRSSIHVQVGGGSPTHFPSLSAATGALAALDNVTPTALDAGCVFRLLFRDTRHLQSLFWGAVKQMQLPLDQPYTAWNAFFPHRDFTYSSTTHIVPRDINVTAVCEAYSVASGDLFDTVLLTSNFYQFKWTCAGAVARRPHFVDLGLDGPRAAVSLGAVLLDLLLLLHAAAITHGNTTLGRLAARIVGMNCNPGRNSIVHCVAPCATPLRNLSFGRRPTTPERQVRELFADELAQPVRTCATGTRFVPTPRQRSLRYVQQLVHDWQNPPPEQCKTSKFLLYEPVLAGIGSMAHTAAAALGIAISSGRILKLISHRSKSPWTNGTDCPPAASWLECFFEPVTSCTNSPSGGVPMMGSRLYLGIRSKQFVRANDPTKHKLMIPRGPGGYCVLHKSAGAPPGEVYQRLRRHLSDRHVVASGILLRYLLRPRPFFAMHLQDLLDGQRGLMEWLRPPLPFTAVHIRYGDKGVEAAVQPLHVYATLLGQQNVTRAFISTETEAVLRQFPLLCERCSMFNLSYARKGKDLLGADPVAELAWSFANLLVSLKATAFVGTRSSNWCRLMEELAATSGWPDRPYFSLDTGHWPICFPP
eukprot:EG_transcript_4648